VKESARHPGVALCSSMLRSQGATSDVTRLLKQVHRAVTSHIISIYDHSYLLCCNVIIIAPTSVIFPWALHYLCVLFYEEVIFISSQSSETVLIVSTVNIGTCIYSSGSRGSSVSIVSDYRLEDRAIEVRSSAGVKDFSSSLCVHTVSGAHPASRTMGTGVLSPGIKRGRSVTLTTHLHSAEVMNE
jgi:hypothetical protein